MDTCGATRLLVPGFLIGLGVASMTGSDLIGWLAAALTVGVLLAVQRVRGTAAACRVAPTDGVRPQTERPSELPADTSSSS